MDIIETIKSRYDGLTKKQKKIADYMINHIDKMSFITMKELSDATSVTEVTILNACAALGFPSFKEFKYEARKYLGLREKLFYMRAEIWGCPRFPNMNWIIKRSF